MIVRRAFFGKADTKETRGRSIGSYDTGAKRPADFRQRHAEPDGGNQDQASLVSLARKASFCLSRWPYPFRRSNVFLK